MTRRPRNNPRLPLERDWEILRHVMLYRLTTPEVLHKLFFSDSERNAVTKVTSRLCALEFLESRSFFDRYIYFTLGRRGAKTQGIAYAKAGIRGAQSLYREYATLAFCMKNHRRRWRVRSGEFREKYPTLVLGRLDTSHYFLETSGEGDTQRERLGYIWADGGGGVDHIVRTLKNDVIETRRLAPDFRRLIDSGSFYVAVVTMTAGKAQDLIKAIPNIPHPVQFYVEVIPELIHILPGSPHV